MSLVILQMTMILALLNSTQICISLMANGIFIMDFNIVLFVQIVF